MKPFYVSLVLLLSLKSLASDPRSLFVDADPFIGTGGRLSAPGFTFPGATSPFGLVRLSPDTRFKNAPKKWLNKTNMATSGYSWHHDEVIGFSHTRYSGTGVSEGGLFSVRPALGTKHFYKKGVSLKLEHKHEIATPGYYSIRFPKAKLKAELTSTTHCGFHRYSRDKGSKEPLSLFISGTSGLYNNKLSPDSQLQLVAADRSLSGSTKLFGQFSKRYGGLPAFFYATWSAPTEKNEMWNNKDWRVTDVTAGGNIGAGLQFNSKLDAVELKLCISHVSAAGAKLNYEAQALGRSFDHVRRNTKASWQGYLDRITLTSDDKRIRRIFASALYHSMLMPSHFADVSGQYLDFSGTIATAKSFTYRSDMSLWDTFRTTHPLYTLITPEIQRDVIHSLIDMGLKSGVVPRWPSGGGDSGSMFGSPANFIFTESYLKGITDFDVQAALKLMVSSTVDAPPANTPGRVPACYALGYCASDDTHGSVSKTLEYAWADAAVRDLAFALGEFELADEFDELSSAFENVWDAKTRFFRPKNRSGKFQKFSPKLTPYLGFLGHGTDAYAEGSAWQWRFSVPHDTHRLIELMGGEKKFVKDLNTFMKKASKARGALYPGAYYWHGNQHDLHTIYLFNDAGRPDLTQKWARWALDKRYNDSPSGLDGNDDAGTLSAWYVLSSVGLYPKAGTNMYWLGSPNIQSARLDLGSSRSLVITSKNQSSKNIYVQSVALNGKRLCQPTVRHQDLFDATLTFEMGPHPAAGGGYSCP